MREQQSAEFDCDKRGPGGECVRDHEPCPDFPSPPEVGHRDDESAREAGA